MSATKSETFQTVKDYLLKFVDDGPDKSKLIAGAVPSIWMTVPPAPKHDFDEVYPNILLGWYSIAKDKEKLKDQRVTHVVNCAQGTKLNQINTDQSYFDDGGIKFHGIRAFDIFTFKMYPHFEAAAAFIDDALNSGGRVYVHCQSGVSRSGVIVLAFLVLKRNMTAMEAITAVRAKREIFPNDGFLRQLADLSDTIHAKKQST